MAQYVYMHMHIMGSLGFPVYLTCMWEETVEVVFTIVYIIESFLCNSMWIVFIRLPLRDSEHNKVADGVVAESRLHDASPLEEHLVLWLSRWKEILLAAFMDLNVMKTKPQVF